ncbi:MAG: hypothetical protein KME07_18120 [Pegethrix bostrychoides GSE-TBD4-15B]|jgi:hypothetical protein|uniref:Uncharacterized protein n=1 Tax=Pegethrix bostrychoides GSE-TBD4-15B TaxID=2839662 RepID=A0A951PCT1_9CYAN|nr:hypothetical protein [Pegethrix bostrychoides GSE-TBD4-15B]
MTSSVPDWLRGLWKRISIETADGQIGSQTQVFYLQTSACFGDLRLPIDRPDLRQASFASLTSEEALALAQQQGFAGIAQFKQDQFKQGQCEWLRYIDYQPSQPDRDLGLLYWQDDILIEDGVDQVYREQWRKVDDGAGDYTALVWAEGAEDVTWQASLVIAGDYFIYSQNRPVALPAANALSDCLATATTLQDQQTYLGCEISFGRCQAGREPWEIQRSTLPWRESTALWSPSDLTVDLVQQRVLQTVPQADQRGACPVRVWEIREWGTGRAFQA